MSDFVGYTPGSGEQIAVDNIPGGKVQRVKVMLGPDGVDGGDVSNSTPLPISDNRATALLFQLVQLLMSPAGFDKSLNRTRTTTSIESGTLNAVISSGDQATIGGRPAQMMINQTNLSAWADCVRARIT